MKTADRPHIITILVSLSALALSLFSLQQSCSAQRATKATSRAMLVLKSAELTGPYMVVHSKDVHSKDDPGYIRSATLLFQIENVGKAIAHNPSLQYYVQVNSNQGLSTGTIKFMDDPPATPVVGEGGFLDLRLDKQLGVAPSDTLNVHYTLSYDDEATGTHFDEKESCGRFSVDRRPGNFPMLPCYPK